MNAKLNLALCFALSAGIASAGSFTAACSVVDFTGIVSGSISCPLYSGAAPLTGVDLIFSGSENGTLHLRSNIGQQDVTVDFAASYAFYNSATPLFSVDKMVSATLPNDGSYVSYAIGGVNQADAGVDQTTIGSYVGNGFVLIPVSINVNQTVLQGQAVGSFVNPNNIQASGTVTYFTNTPEPASLILLLTALAVLPATMVFDRRAPRD